MSKLLSIFGVFDLLAFFSPGVVIIFLLFKLGIIDTKPVNWHIVIYVIAAYIAGQLNSQLSKLIEKLIGVFYDIEINATNSISQDIQAVLQDKIKTTIDSVTLLIFNNSINKESVINHIGMHKINYTFAINMLLPIIALSFAYFNESNNLIGTLLLSSIIFFIMRYVRHKKKYIKDLFLFSYFECINETSRNG